MGGMAEQFGFEKALEVLRGGGRVTRPRWHDRHLQIDERQVPQGIWKQWGYWQSEPWTPAQGDLLATDWMVYAGPISNPPGAGKISD